MWKRTGLPIGQEGIERRVEVLFGRLTGLYQIVIDPGRLDGADRRVVFRICRKQDALGIGEERDRLIEEFDPVHLRHPPVGQKKRHRLAVILQLPQLLERLPPGSRAEDAVSLPVLTFEVALQQAQLLLVILNDKKYWFGHTCLKAATAMPSPSRSP